MISRIAVPSAPAPGKPHGGFVTGGSPSRSRLLWNDLPVIPPLDEMSTPLELRVPVDIGRSPVVIGLGVVAAGPQVVQLVAKTPLRPSEMTPTLTPVPSAPRWLRTWLASTMASPSVSTEPVWRTAELGRRTS